MEIFSWDSLSKSSSLCSNFNFLSHESPFGTLSLALDLLLYPISTSIENFQELQFDSMASTSSATASSNASQNFVVQPALSQPLQQGLMPTPYHRVAPLSLQTVHDTTSVLSLNLNVDGLLKEWEEKQSVEADKTSKSNGLQDINMSTSSIDSLPDNDRLSVAPATKVSRVSLVVPLYDYCTSVLSYYRLKVWIVMSRLWNLFWRSN